MGSEAAVGLIFRREIAAAADPEATRAALIEDYQRRFASPYQAASRGYVDDVIEPRRTRPWLIRALAIARTKQVQTPRRKHGNIPL
jgi:acetyl-CoA carboxylase carboxyltransferase component